jgi:hypothetical protein
MSRVYTPVTTDAAAAAHLRIMLVALGHILPPFSVGMGCNSVAKLKNRIPGNRLLRSRNRRRKEPTLMSQHPDTNDEHTLTDRIGAMETAVRQLTTAHSPAPGGLFAQLHENHQAEIQTIMERLDDLDASHDQNEPNQMHEAHDNIVDRIINLANRVATLELRL